MKKNFLCFLTIFCLLSSSTTAFAANLSEAYTTDAEQRFVQILNMSAGLSISSLGKATCGGEVSVRPGYNVSLTINLLKLENNSWTTIKSWIHTGSGVAGVNESETYWVDHGTYMTEIVAYVTDSSGKYIESPSATSLIREY